MPGYDYFLAINNGVGASSLSEITINESKTRLREQLQTSIHYDPTATRNGKQQGFVIVASESYYKSKIEALPGEELYVGDIIYSHGEHWIVRNTRVTSPFQTTGLIWMCNYKFRWQNGTSDIIERWGVLDSGVYSSTRDGDKTAMTADKQFKIYLPYDDDTKYLHMDKRLSTGVIYDSNQQAILNVQRITGVDPVSISYGQGGHLLSLNSRSDDFVAPNDNVELGICDYIAPDSPTPSEFKGTIFGSETIRLGGTRTYTADFDVAEWQVSEISGVTYTANGNSLTLRVARDDDLLGEEISVAGINADGQYARIIVEVID